MKILPKTKSIFDEDKKGPPPVDLDILSKQYIISHECLYLKLDEPELMPYKKHDTDAGWDLRAAEDYDIYPGKNETIQTGVKLAIPKGYVGLLIPRSSTGSNGLILRNTVGVIDADYRGYIMCRIRNTSGGNMFIQKYERFVQLLILPVPKLNTMVVDELPDTERGEDGFGASGKI